MFSEMAGHRKPADPTRALPAGSRSWRDIRQGVNPQAMSRAGRRRRLMAGVKVGAIAAVLVAAGAGVWTVHRLWRENPARIKEPGPGTPLRQVVFSTNGVLDRRWVGRALALPRDSSLMTLNLHALEHRLLASGQVLGATLRRRFRDDSLVVTLRERSPVARLMAQGDNGRTRELLVAADGVVFAGAGYGRDVLDRLPWLDGFRLRRTARHGFAPVAGMDRVGELLSAARKLVPRLYDGWRVVSLARLASDKEILVRSHAIPEIVFDAGSEFPRQLEKLAYIVDAIRTHGNPPVARVDFTVGSQVPVELQDAAAHPLAPSLTFPPRAHPPPRRDF